MTDAAFRTNVGDCNADDRMALLRVLFDRQTHRFENAL